MGKNPVRVPWLGGSKVGYRRRCLPKRILSAGLRSNRIGNCHKVIRIDSRENPERGLQMRMDGLRKTCTRREIGWIRQA